MTLRPLVCLLATTLVAGSLVSSPAHAATPLRWAPPVLVNPVTLQLGSGYTSNTLDVTKDYILKLPATKKIGGTVIKGGHNVVIIGGSITVPAGATSDAQRRGIYIKDNVGTVHIEGVSIDNPDNIEFDGIAIDSPNSIVQVENCRITGIARGVTGFHADIIQPFGGVQQLRIDRLTGSSNYQGLQIPIDGGPIEQAVIQNVNLSHEYTNGSVGGYLLWLTTGSTSGNTYDITLSNVYIVPRTNSTTGARSVWPSTSQPAGYTAVQVGNEVSWPNLPTVKGVVWQGTPPGGDYVPDGLAGLNYVSPGYCSLMAVPPANTGLCGN